MSVGVVGHGYRGLGVLKECSIGVVKVQVCTGLLYK